MSDDSKDNVYLTLHSYDTTSTNALGYADASVSDVVDLFYGAMVACQFNPSSVLRGMLEYCGEHMEDDEFQETCSGFFPVER